MSLSTAYSAIFVITSFCSIASAAPVTYKDFEARAYKISSTQTLPYRLFKPKGYSPANKYPIMITLHGAGERGTDDSVQLKHKFSLMWADSASQAIRPSFVLAPQCPPAPNQWVNRPWDSGSYDFNKVPISTSLQAVVNILDSLGREFSLDPDRYYVSGISMGGYGAWYLLMKYPTKFAAAVPVCGAADPKTAATLTDVPIWAFHAADDPVVPVSGSRDIINEIKAKGGHPKYTEYPATQKYGHNAWDPASKTPDLVPWVYSQSRSTVSIRVNGNRNKAFPGLGKPASIFEIDWNGNKTDATGRNRLP